MGEHKISIARDFSPTPAGRLPKDGPFNGQRFREQFLVPSLAGAIEEKSKLVIDFDDADSYSSSFLEEVFGGLVRLNKFTGDQIRNCLVFKSDDPVFATYVADARQYLEDALKVAA
jgi:STAS-like domain of unknown function (DUF4325)